MPKENIDRAVSRAADVANLEEVTYEGFGPGGVGVIVEATTDNRNRTVQELKQIFDRNGGSLGTPNSVSFNFDTVGMIVLPVSVANDEDAMLKLIDMGVEDIMTEEDGVVVYTKMNELSMTRQKLEEGGIAVEDSNIVRRPKMTINITEETSDKVNLLLEKLEDHDDVQQVFTNVG
jgi:YebC/PmpR family DNA-binding regulatory protein